MGARGAFGIQIRFKLGVGWEKEIYVINVNKYARYSEDHWLIMASDACGVSVHVSWNSPTQQPFGSNMSPRFSSEMSHCKFYFYSELISYIDGCIVYESLSSKHFHHFLRWGSYCNKDTEASYSFENCVCFLRIKWHWIISHDLNYGYYLCNI